MPKYLVKPLCSVHLLCGTQSSTKAQEWLIFGATYQFIISSLVNVSNTGRLNKNQLDLPSCEVIKIPMPSDKYVQCGKDKSHFYNQKLGSCPFCDEQKQSLRGTLSGWLCTFDMDPNGVSFELRQGVNKIGSGTNCHIQIANDPNVSLHAADIVIQGNNCSLQCLQEAENTIGHNGRIIRFGEKTSINPGSGIMIGSSIYYYIRINTNR